MEFLTTNILTQSLLEQSEYYSALGHLPLLGDRLPRNEVFQLLTLDTYDLPKKIISNYIVIFCRDNAVDHYLSTPFTRARIASLKLYLQESYNLPTRDDFTSALAIYISILYPEYDLDAYPSLMTCICPSSTRKPALKGNNLSPNSSYKDLYKNGRNRKGGE